jgi:hypothetical protein
VYAHGKKPADTCDQISGFEMLGTNVDCELPTSADGRRLLYHKVNTEPLLDASKDVGVETNEEKSKYVVPRRRHVASCHNMFMSSLLFLRTHDYSVRASEDSSCLRSRGHCDRLAFERAKTVHALDRAATVTG